MFHASPAHPNILISGAQLLATPHTEVRLRDGRICEIGVLQPLAGERVIDAAGGLLLPGLHDHHIHVAACAAAHASVACGPPNVHDAAGLRLALVQPGGGWLRGVGYHETVAGMIGRDWLDAVAPDRPVRVQHRSGRMWVLNSAALDLLLGAGEQAPPGMERADGRYTGRLFDEDAWLRTAMGSAPPAFDTIGTALARYGVTGLTEMSPLNTDTMARHFAAEQARGVLPQRVLIAGTVGLTVRGDDPLLTTGPVKIHLHEAHLPALDDVVALIRAAHSQERGVAVHCVTEVELMFTLAAFDEAGSGAGDRLEHASVANMAAVERIAALGLPVVAQPNFVAERGDAYRALVAPNDWQDLYRLRSLSGAGIVLAGGTDAPFGRIDPWAAMTAAVTRRTAAGWMLGEAEALTPEAALALFLADPLDLAQTRTITTGAVADLCLLTQPWSVARENLHAGLVRSVLIGGRLIHDRIDQAPAQGSAGIDPLA